MSVGQQPSTGSIDNTLTNLAVNLREIMQDMSDLSTQVNSQGSGVTYLANIGYSTAPSATNPGGVSDAQLAANYIDYFNTITGVYFGTVQQGGSGGTGATTFNFNNALSQLWNGR